MLRVLRNRSLKDVGRELQVIGNTGFRAWRIARDAYDFAAFEGAEYWCREMARLLRVLAQAPPHCVLEIGVGSGGSMFAWARASANDALLIGVDDFEVKTLSSTATLTIGEMRDRIYASGAMRDSQTLQLISGNSHLPQVKQSVLSALGERHVTFLFIDGDHTYEGVRQDYYDYSPLVGEGGVIAFHDIVPDFKTRYGTETRVYSGGVHKFWDEIKSGHHGIAIIDNAEQDGCGIGVIRGAAGNSSHI
jgi:cephalosporin hydroxylase